MPKKKDISIKEYREILNTIELDSICLIDGSFKLIKEKLTDEIKLVIKESSKFELKEGLLIVRYKSSLKGINEETKDASIIANTIHEISYCTSGEKEITDEFLNKFSTFSTSMIIWPYFREYVQNMVSRSQMPPLILPLKKIV